MQGSGWLKLVDKCMLRLLEPTLAEPVTLMARAGVERLVMVLLGLVLMAAREPTKCWTRPPQ